MNCLRARLFLACVIILAGSVLPCPMFAATEDDDTGKVFVGYVFRRPEEINFDEYDYDGIDLDWEYPDTAAEVTGFERLARRFRRQLDRVGKEKGRPMLQRMAVSANPNTLKWLSNDVLLETMNWVNVFQQPR